MSKVKSDTMGTMDVRYFNILEKNSSACLIPSVFNRI